ncbi:DegT/DnrJ/EryC1/StrS family aminotransferase, partial [Desulfovibrio desulfuricans]|nr:DegT/DnrJ/EryC1/StrS family aminotransferase [Desulfovibrio desulfuricans]
IRIANVGERERNEIIVKMAEKGIACNVHYKPLPLLTAYKQLGFNIDNYPNAYKLYCNEITLPLYNELHDEQVDYIINELNAILEDF